jgi:hypothetical protein
MEFEVRWVDVTQNLLDGVQPVYLLSRPLPAGGARHYGQSEAAREGEFWSLQTPVVGVREVGWSVVRTGDHVRVPVNAYQISPSGPSSVLGFGVQVGVLALASLREQWYGKPRQVILVLGSVVHTLPDPDTVRAYVGLAFRTK